jgi:hypothetical protein
MEAGQYVRAAEAMAISKNPSSSDRIRSWGRSAYSDYLAVRQNSLGKKLTDSPALQESCRELRGHWTDLFSNFLPTVSLSENVTCSE